jgi:membrane peptidoglycan carboxypeptidase
MNKLKIFKTLAIIFALSTVLFGLGGVVYFAITYSAINLDRELEEPSVILDREGKEVGRFAAELREVVELDEVSPFLIQATIAVEDARFYEHFGLDIRGIGRAMWRNLLGRRVREGGSTITQQLAKNEYFIGQQGPARTIERKLREAIYAIKLERTFTKDEILARYLNRIYYGHGRFGIESASRFYFNKSSADLTLAEAAMLAGIPNGPALFSPRINPDRANERKNFVLGRLLDTGDITQAQYDEATQIYLTPAELQERPARANHFRQRVEREVRQILTALHNLEEKEVTNLIYSQGLQIFTTLCLRAQAAAEQVMLRHGEDLLQRFPDMQGVLIAIDPGTGGIVATVESINLRGTFLRADGTRYDVGSSMKGILYTSALQAGFTAASMVVCEPTEFPRGQGLAPYTPSDANGTFHNRSLSLREALRFSCNVVAVKVNLDIGPQRYLDLTARLNPNLRNNAILEPRGEMAVPLSPHTNPLDLALVHAPLVNGGYSVTPHTVQEIRDRDGNVLYRAYPARQWVLDERYGFIATSMLQEVQAGQGLPFDTAGKTGTSQRGRVVFVGYSSNLVATVLFGPDDPMQESFGSAYRIAAPVWREFMRQALAGTDPAPFRRPQGIEEAVTCAVSGKRATAACPETYIEFFMPGTVPEVCEIHGGATVEVCMSSWRPVNQWCPPHTRIRIPREPWIPPTLCDVHGPSGEGEGEGETNQGGGTQDGDDLDVEGED